MTTWSGITWKFCEHFLLFLEKRPPLKLLLLHISRPKPARASPHIWLTLYQISSKLVHFRRSYCRIREDRFCPTEYLQYRLFEPIIANLLRQYDLKLGTGIRCPKSIVTWHHSLLNHDGTPNGRSFAANTLVKAAKHRPSGIWWWMKKKWG